MSGATRAPFVRRRATRVGGARAALRALLAGAALVSLAACAALKDPYTLADGATRDAAGEGGAGDGGPGDAATDARTDAARDGATDPCAEPVGAPATTVKADVGCNGGPMGAPATGELGGECSSTAACTTPSAFCNYTTGSSVVGICTVSCAIDSSLDVATSTCPYGFRCFAAPPTDGICYLDCIGDADCPSRLCDPDGSCLSP